MTEPSFIIEGTRDNFQQLVSDNSRRGLVMVDFWAPWVGPSLRQQEILTRLVREYAGRFLLVTVNTDEQKSLAEDYVVRSLPLIKLFRQGKVVESAYGVQPEADYRALVERHLTPLAGRAQAAALRAWQMGNQDKAIQLLAEAAMAEPLNLGLPKLLAKLLMQQGRSEDAQAVLTSLPPEARQDGAIARLSDHLEFILVATKAADEVVLEQHLAANPDDFEACLQLASRRLIGDRYPAAAEQLLDLLQRAPSFRDGIARRGLEILLDLLDPTDDLVKKIRSALFRLDH